MQSLSLRERIFKLTGSIENTRHHTNKATYHVMTESENKGVITQKVVIKLEDHEGIPTFILKPKNEINRPGILCLHQTTVDETHGAGEAAGIVGNPHYAYALELARQGFVTIAPDYPFFGSYQISEQEIYEKQGYKSVTMKGIVNHMAAIDILESLVEVDSNRIGCIGHSLGGTNALLSTFFDQRIKATVISAGFTTFERYAATSPSGNLSRWALRKKYMPFVESQFDKDPSKMPFNFPELLSSLYPVPLFMSTPKRDEIFDYEGAMTCVEAVQEVYGNSTALEIYAPDVEHDFPNDIRSKAYLFLKHHLKWTQ